VATGVAVAALVLAGATWSLLPADVHRAFEWIQFDPAQSIRGTVSHVDRLPAFVATLFTTFWLSAGWLRYQAPDWWYGVPLGITLIATAGLLAPGAASVAQRRVRLFALAMFIVQTAIVIAFYFGVLQTGPQGRYLFPVMPAIVSLLWLGWCRWFGADRAVAAISLIAIMGVLNITAWTLVIAPAYL
jgi:hypothetical protein